MRENEMSTTVQTGRTIHSSYVNLDPAEYEYVDGFDSQPEAGSFFGTPAEYVIEGETIVANNYYHADYLYLTRKLRQSETSVWDGSGQCDHCGAHIRYVAVMFHKPTQSHMAIGETCSVERFGHVDKLAKDIDRLRKRAAAARARTRTLERLDRWVEESSDNLATKFYLDTYHLDGDRTNDFYVSLRNQMYQKGELSERQVSALLRSVSQTMVREAQRETEVKVPAPEGRVVVSGEIVSLKWHTSDFGDTEKMTVKCTTPEGIYLVWATVPSSVCPEVGDNIEFTATLTRSDRDEGFAFGKRPSGAKLRSSI
jgi:hypothetical protein